ncbi:MAG: S4 domain-containing protein [Rhizobiaceae bacterium]|jgi:ribosome-associated heat shock protein Hsp15|nr:S4 domain-containing protein [Rhizobiaceae bacterium]
MTGPDTAPKLRLDKWLVHARFAKTRGVAAAMVGKGAVRINGRKIEKPDAGVRVGDVLTLSLSRDVAVLRVLALGERRGSPADARRLFDAVTSGTQAAHVPDDRSID